MELVNVAVPEDRLLEVYALLSKPRAPGADEIEPEAGVWDKGTLRPLLREASSTIQGLARYLAQHPGEEVGTDEVAEALDLPYGWNSLAGALGAFGRKLGNRGQEFPWEVWYSPEDGRTRMKMQPEVASLVLEVL